MLTMTVTDRGALGGRPGVLRSKLVAFSAGLHAAQKRSAATATQASRAQVQRKRPIAPPRKNRYHGLKDAIDWSPDPDGTVKLDLDELTRKFPPWIVQEIGTGQRAVQREAGVLDSRNTVVPRGRPAKARTDIKTVKSQKGRIISPGLVFATQGGQYTRPGGASGQQLYLRSKVKGAPVRFDPRTNRSAAGIQISKEIEGQHFIQKGGREGFREYRSSVLAAARTQLKKGKAT